MLISQKMLLQTQTIIKEVCYLSSLQASAMLKLLERVVEILDLIYHKMRNEKIEEE